MADFFVHVDGERGDTFARVLGDRVVPVVSPVAVPCRLPIGERPCFMLDLEALDGDQYGDLLEYLARAFDQHYGDVVEEVHRRGVPILAEGCTLVFNNAMRWL